MTTQAGLPPQHVDPQTSQTGSPTGIAAGSPLPAQIDPVQAELKKIRQEVLRWRSTEGRSQRWEDEMEVNDDEEVEESNPLTWTSVLKPVEVEAVTETGVGLYSLLAAPPPLDDGTCRASPVVSHSGTNKGRFLYVVARPEIWADKVGDLICLHSC